MQSRVCGEGLGVSCLIQDPNPSNLAADMTLSFPFSVSPELETLKLQAQIKINSTPRAFGIHSKVPLHPSMRYSRKALSFSWPFEVWLGDDVASDAFGRRAQK